VFTRWKGDARWRRDFRQATDCPEIPVKRRQRRRQKRPWELQVFDSGGWSAGRGWVSVGRYRTRKHLEDALDAYLHHLRSRSHNVCAVHVRVLHKGEVVQQAVIGVTPKHARVNMLY